MKEPTIAFYVLLVTCSLVFAVVGLFFLANFGRLFRSKIKNDLFRKNVLAWLIIFFLSSAITPLSGGFFNMLAKFGWVKTIGVQIAATFLYTLVVYNIVRAVAESKRLKALSFVKHKLLILAVLIISSLAINILIIYTLYCTDKQYMVYLKYSVISNIFTTAVIGLVYAVLNYLGIEQKRKFDEKELELSRLRELKTKAELDVLHSKINPHFLYNALNSIADLSITDGKKARKMTIALADLFRYSINYSDHNYSTIKDEIQMAEAYMQIEKIRFEDKLNYTFHVADELSHYLVPRFILQPVVENAVKHGLKATGMMTEINIEVKNENDSMQINIADNGPAFPDELTPGYGLKSIYDKLDLLFPGAYEVYFANQPYKRVSIHINKLMKSEPGV
jgi:two-component system, LytTR family, sensor kinase